MTLTLAIPAHNDTGNLKRLLHRVAEIGLADQMIVIDDGSDIPIDADELRTCVAADFDKLTLLRNEQPRGPGPARNRAILHTKTDHLLFLDADDLPTRELPDLLSDLKGSEFDFCIFQHHDTRMEQELAWGQPHHDQAHWRAAGVDLGALSPVSSKAAAHLVQTANYPWNKIYRTEFLRAHAIGCSDILVHEDIELHWRSFLNAETILVSDRVGVIHFVTPGGDRLTNRTGPERLALFAPLERIGEEIMAKAPGIYALPFFSFVLGLFDWIAGNLAAEHHDAFSGLVRDFIMRRPLPLPLQEQIHQTDPDRTDRVLARADLEEFRLPTGATAPPLTTAR